MEIIILVSALCLSIAVACKYSDKLDEYYDSFDEN